ncbi:MAG: AMP-binding protein [Clostridia bacterium]|nr:AMP-binding protein [Clostridia bacterium]
MNSIVEKIAYHAKVKPDTVAITAAEESITYSELYDRIRGFCAFLKNMGVEKGNRVVAKASHTIS